MSERRVQASVVWAEKDRYLYRQLELDEGTTAAEAVRQSGLLEELQMTLEQLAGIGIWGRRLDGRELPLAEQYAVADGDRVELYRPLPLSPKELRRLRARSAKRS